MPRIVAFFLLLSASRAAADDPLEVAGGLGEMVSAALSERARELWKQRDEAVLRLDSTAGIEERQRYVRERFVEALGGCGVPVMVRKRKGDGVSGACGQLRARRAAGGPGC